ncbi:ATP-binding cassette domain-containing protein [Robbsia sp. KACC 23696]|uniref:ATP-binding cassette domain-containing protein n=1 Tax=Robbsia sp. KACC 23696 TaxID=3149231 RepID=UPI00325B8921
MSTTSRQPAVIDAASPVIRVDDAALHYPVASSWLTQFLASKRRAGATDFGIVRAVDGVSFDVAAGRCFAIVGESGSGKSSLARLIVGLHRPTSGEVFVDGVQLSTQAPAALRSFRRHVQMVLQDPRASLDPRMNIYAIMKEALIVHRLHPGVEPQRERIEAVLRRVGLGPAFLPRFPHQLSGGQRQRVAIARALLCEPDVLVLDEPVSALDVSVQAQIINLLVSLQQEFGLTYIMITHDLSLVAHMADAVGVMRHGKFVEQGDALQVCYDPQHAYTKHLLSSVPGGGFHSSSAAS